MRWARSRMASEVGGGIVPTSLKAALQIRRYGRPWLSRSNRCEQRFFSSLVGGPCLSRWAAVDRARSMFDTRTRRWADPNYHRLWERTQ